MNTKLCMIALALLSLTACQNGQPADPQAAEPLDSDDLSRLALQHDIETRQELRNSDDTFIEPGTPVAITGVCEIARDVPLFTIDWPEHEADEVSDFRRYYRAHLEDNPQLAQMREGQHYLVEGRIGRGSETMCYGAYFIEVERFTLID